MTTQEKYYKYISDLFDASVEFERCKGKLSSLSLGDARYADAEKASKEAERKFLTLCQSVLDEYRATNPTTEEVKALLQVMNAFHQGHYGRMY
ncbi:hypothetical protein [Prevotella communis]|uniref:hypothetical protein n=1 Tax=Prevotella communis TaxID=2913614 RepID=UPI001EDBD336|nr:hypothetical protein [Prevotella communis]UKK56801.1 hypothetical protein L6476_00665 [Prevotella communis]